MSCTPLVPVTGPEITVTPAPSDNGVLPVTVLDEMGNPFNQELLCV